MAARHGRSTLGSPPSGAEPPPQSSDQWGLVIVAGLTIFMAQLDTTVVNVALPHIEADLGVTTALTQWIVLAYLIPLIGFSLLTGRWLDTVGRRPALTVAVTGFAVASVAAGMSPNAALLLTARALQGVFGALMLALAPVLAIGAVREAARGCALGIIGTLAPLGAMSGPLVGGWLVDSMGWPWIFHTNVPAAALILVLGLRQLPPAGRLRLPRRSRLLEATVLMAAATAILLATTLVAGGNLYWMALSLVALPLLGIWSRLPGSRPVRSLLMTQPGMAAVHVAFIAVYTVMLLVQFLIPFYLVRVLGASAITAGLTLLALPAATAATGVLSGAAADRVGSRAVALAGALTIVVGVSLLLPLSGSWVAASTAWRLAVLGFGLGLFMTPAMALALNLAPRHLLGVTSASVNIARFLGLALGPAVATAVWSGSPQELPGMRSAIAAGVVVSLVAIIALLRARQRDADPTHPITVPTDLQPHTPNELEKVR